MRPFPILRQRAGRGILAALGGILLASCQAQKLPARPPMERIAISADHHGFVLLPSGRTFHPWGNNYGHEGRLIEDFWATNWPALEEDFREMKRMGANVARVSLQFGKFMRGPDQPDPDSLARLGRLVQLAEQTGLYLDLTGLGCYRRADVPVWYDKLSEADRWRAQARFWEAIAAQCAESPAIYCYDLINEPIIATEKRNPGDWYTGAFGDMNFIQFLNLDPAGRTLDDIAVNWGLKMGEAIHKKDRRHLITAGLLPFNPGTNILSRFDFVSVHIYPEAGKVGNALDTLRQFNIGKPVVIEETFPLSCSAAELRKFILDSRGDACGWIGHYNGEPIARFEGLQQSGKLTVEQSVWLAWLQLFRELGPTMAPPN